MSASNRGWVLALALLSGCAVGPDFKPPPPPGDHAPIGGGLAVLPEAGGLSQHLVADRVPEQWWHEFGSVALDALMTRALGANGTLEAARHALAQSEEQRRAGYGIFFPQIDADASATRERYSPLKIGEALPSSIFNLFTVSASVSYALDLFGGQRRLVEQLGAQVQLARANEQAAYLTLESNLVNAFIARAAYQAEREALADEVGATRDAVCIARARVEAGAAPASDVLGLEGAADGAETAQATLAVHLAQSEDLLAALSGQRPGEGTGSAAAWAELKLPVDLPRALPSALVRQRPDIRAAEAMAHAASAQVGIDTAALLPSVTLSGALANNALRSGALFDAAGRSWQVGAGASLPLIDGGTRWFERRAAVQAYRASMAQYRQSVLDAFAQVADTLEALDHDAEAQAAGDRAEQAAAQTLALVRANDTAGLVNDLAVLAAQAQWRQAQIAAIQARALRLQDTVALYAALGGGWR